MSQDEVIPQAANVPTPEEYAEIARRLHEGAIVPFFGSGASLGCGKLPSAQDLARRIAERAEFPDPLEGANLALVASYLVQISSDSVGLDLLLREVFEVQADVGAIHRCIAAADQVRLIVTTNYDDLIERALEARWAADALPWRKPWYVVDRGAPGAVSYREPGTVPVEVEAKNLRDRLTDPETPPGQELRRRPILFKMHGSLDRLDRDQDWFLITEEHYVDFLGRPDAGQVPPMLMSLMRNSSFLFLGYGLRDWNVRVMLRKMMLTRNPGRRIQSWAVVKSATIAEKRLWNSHGVKIFELDLDEFARELQARL